MSEEEQQQQQNGNSWIGSPSRNSWIKELEEFCGSDDLSVDELRRMTKGSYDLEGSSCIHRVCLNKNVTLEIVKYLLDLYPSAMHSLMDIPDRHIFSAYPLHMACCNKKCPNEVIQLLLDKIEGSQSETVSETICLMKFDYGDTGIELREDEYHVGAPIHYYLSTSNVDLNIVKQLVSSERILLLTNRETKCSPIHILMHNKRVEDMFDVVKYLVELNPSSLRKKDKYGQTPLHVACGKSYIKTRTIQVLLEACQDAAYQRNNFTELPIHNLCEYGKDDDDAVARDNLKLLLEAHPDSVTQTNDDIELPLHVAAWNKSPAFCKILADAYPESVRRGNGPGSLPLHCACNLGGRPDTVEYLFGLYPESLNIRDINGYLPIHLTCDRNPDENTPKVIKFLLLHDAECLSKTVMSDNRGSRHVQGNEALPLHIVCSKWDRSNVTELLFDLYPEAILIRNGLGKLPIDIIRQELDSLTVNPQTGVAYNPVYQKRLQYIISFLQTQMSYAKKAQDKNAMRTPEWTGSLPLHNALYALAPLGSIKLLVKGNPDAINVPDGYGVHPFDIACQFSTVGVVKYLAELSPDRLNACDVDKDYPLHHACRGGNCEVIQHLLERPMSSASVSERNTDDKLPIHLFCEFVKRRWCEGETPEYTETIWRLLSAYPETVLNW